MEISLIIGLGNPGRQYEGTRHNVGFMLMDKLAAAEGVVFQNVPKWQTHVAKLPCGTMLIKPQTFMNLSGRAVQQVMSFFKMEKERILVVYDDVALPLGSMRFREKGSAGGHNGIKSIIQHLGGDDFVRLKLGIGGTERGEMVGHVLGKFSLEEAGEVENMLATACEAVQIARSQGVSLASNRYNTPRTKPIPKTNEPQIPRSDHPEHEEPRG